METDTGVRDRYRCKIQIFKTHLVIGGNHQVEAINYKENNSPMARLVYVSLALAIAAAYDMELHQMGVTWFFSEFSTNIIRILQRNIWWLSSAFSDILRVLGTGTLVLEEKFQDEKIQEVVDLKSIWILITLKIRTNSS
jgi:hypothetical protein